MHRQSIQNHLQLYREQMIPIMTSSPNFDPKHETETQARFIRFIAENNQCFERSSTTGHLTGSAMILDRSLTRIALTLHGKLNKWLQLGGHADGCPDIQEVALREAEEESGLKKIRFYPLPIKKSEAPSFNIPFDLDIHLIPARKAEAEHLHFDVRFLLVSDDEELIISEESTELKWFTLPEARKITDEPSMQRQFNKLEWLLRQKRDT
jgi:8-oxo-dGTP pyrophosphatase MutT (NUDIX family)